MAHVSINNILYLKWAININKYRLWPTWMQRLTSVVNYTTSGRCRGEVWGNPPQTSVTPRWTVPLCHKCAPFGAYGSKNRD